MACTTCNTTSLSEDSLPLPVDSYSLSQVPAVQNTSTGNTCGCASKAPLSKTCSTIKDECHCSPATPVLKLCVKLKSNFSMPAVGASPDPLILFEEDVSNVAVGMILWGKESDGKVIRLEVTKVEDKYSLKVRNTNIAGNTKPVGETIVSGTLLCASIPQVTVSNSPADADLCLIGTFFYPAIGACSSAQVKNSSVFELNGKYSIGGFIWRVGSRPSSTTISLCNDAPGNGSSSAGFIDGGCAGECKASFTPVEGADACSQPTINTSGTPLVCDVSGGGARKLVGTANCQLLRWNDTTKTAEFKALLNGSTTTGPHYIQWDSANPCNSTLVPAPDLANKACTKLACALNLTPLNTGNAYIVDVESTTTLSAVTPNNTIDIGGYLYTINQIITAGTPGKIQITPRFAVTVAQSFAAGTQICTQEGCQPFNGSLFPAGNCVIANGARVYCSEDGLRTLPDSTSQVVDQTTQSVGSIDVNTQAGNFGGANSGVYLNTAQTITVNLNTCRPTKGMFNVTLTSDIEISHTMADRWRGAIDIVVLLDGNGPFVSAAHRIELDNVVIAGANASAAVDITVSGTKTVHMTFPIAYNFSGAAVVSVTPRMVVGNPTAGTVKWLNTTVRTGVHLTSAAI